MAPAAILLLGLIAYPFGRAFYLSFTRTHSAQVGPFVGLDNYISLWGDRFFRQSVGVTIRFTFWSLVFKLLVATLGAVLLHRLGMSEGLLAGLILLPWMMPQVVRAITWRGILDPLLGSVNRILLTTGLLSRPYPFFGDMRTALASVILVEVWQGVPFILINVLAALKGIDRELYEASAIDGAGPVRQFLHITLPGLRYVIAVVLLLDLLWTFNSFELIFLLTGGGPANVTKVYSVLAYEMAVRGRWYSRASAAALAMFPAFLLVIAALGRYVMGGHRVAESSRLLSRLGWSFQGNGAESLLRLPTRKLGDAAWWFADRLELLVAPLARLWPRRGPRVRGQATGLLGRWMAGAGLAALLLFELGPFFLLLITAFKTEIQITRFESLLWPQPWSFAQFERLLAPGSRFLIWLRNTAFVSLVAPVLATLVSALCAYALTRLRWRGARLVSNLILIAYLLPPVLLIIPIHQLFVQLGLNNSLWGLIIIYPALILPFAVWLLMGHYAALPDELEAAALVDGCSRWQAFMRIVLPLAKPALVAVTLFGVTRAWNEFLFAYTLLATEQRFTLPVGLASIVFGDVLPWGQLSAAALIMAVPVLILYVLGQRFLVAGLTAGALKG